MGDRVGIDVVAKTGPDALDFEGARLGKSLIKFVGGDVCFVDVVGLSTGNAAVVGVNDVGDGLALGVREGTTLGPSLGD